MHGVFLDTGTVGSDDLDFGELQACLERWTFHETLSPADVSEAIRDADVVVSNKVQLDRGTLQAADKLKLVCIAATGTNNIDLQAARQNGISVCNVRAYATTSVVEHVFALLLNLNRRMNEYRDAVNRGDWQRAESFSILDYPIRELSGQTLGIIGYGELGKAVARMGEAFGMRIQIAQRPGTEPAEGRIPFREFLQTSDIISLHCPLTAATENLIDAHALGLMRDSAILINTARGGIVDESALAQALKSGQIAGAAIDVLGDEPPHDDNPLLQLSLPSLLVTPHIAWAGINARQALINEVAANIRAFLDGTPRNLVSA